MRKKLLLLFTIALLFPIIGYSQVTVGSSIPANLGAILDIKETSAMGANSNRGLGLSRVELEEIGDLAPCVSNPNALDKIDHIGLVVYNVTEDLSKKLCKGVYVWDGSNWKRLTGTCDSPPITESIVINDLKSSYIMDGSEYTFKVISSADWTATIDDAQNILVTPTASFTGVAGDTDIKFTLKIDNSIDKTASITFTTAGGETVTAQINGEKLLFEYNETQKIIPDPLGETITTLQLNTNSPNLNPTISFTPTYQDFTNWASVTLGSKTTNGDGTLSYPLTIVVKENVTKNRIGKILTKTGLPGSNIETDANIDQALLTLEVDIPTWTSSASGGSKEVTVSTSSTLAMPTLETIAVEWLSATALSAMKTTLTTTANTGVQRVQDVTFKLGTLSATTIVTQDALDFSISEDSWIADPYGDAANKKAITVTTASAENIEVSSSASWLTFSKSGKVITLNVLETNTTGDRSAIVTVKVGDISKTIAVEQAQLTVAVDATTWASAVDGGSKAVTVSTNSTLGTPVMDPVGGTWLSAPALVNQKTILTAKANIDDQRAQTVTYRLGGISATTVVTQVALQFDIDAYAWTADPYGVAANKKAFTVTTNSSKAITFSSPAVAWITQSVAGKVVTLSSTSTNTGALRKANVIVNIGEATKTIAVEQAQLTVTVDATTWASAVDGGSKTVTVSTNSTLGTPVMDPVGGTWLSAPALVNQKTTLTAKANIDDQRAQTVTYKLGGISATTVVTQVALQFDIDAYAWTADPYGVAANKKAFTVTTNSSKAITFSSPAVAWITQSVAGKVVTLSSTSTNAGALRKANVIVNIGEATKTIAVEQAQLTVAVDATTWASGVDGGTKIVTVSTNSTLGTPVMDPVGGTWLSAPALVNKKTTLTAKANIDAQREQTVTYKLGGVSATTKVTQVALQFDIDASSWVADPYGVAANKKAFTVTTNSSKAITFSSPAVAWITQSVAGKVVTLSSTSTNTGALRKANVIVNIGEATKTIAVEQAQLTLAIGGTTPWAVAVDTETKAVPITTNSKLVKPTIKSNQTGWLTVAAVTGSNGTFTSNMTSIGNRGNARAGATITAEITGVPSVTVTRNVAQPLLTMTLSRDMMQLDPLSETLVVTVVTTNSKTRKPVVKMDSGAGYFTVVVGAGTNNGATMSYPMNLTTTDHIVMDAQESAREFRAYVNIPESELGNSFGAVQEKLYISESTPEPLYFARGEAATKTLTFRSNSGKLYIEYNFKRMDESWTAWGNYNFPIDGWLCEVNPHPTVEGVYIYTCSITANGMGTIGGSQEGSVQVKVRENVTPIWNKNARYFLVRRYY